MQTMILYSVPATVRMKRKGFCVWTTHTHVRVPRPTGIFVIKTVYTITYIHTYVCTISMHTFRTNLMKDRKKNELFLTRFNILRD